MYHGRCSSSRRSQNTREDDRLSRHSVIDVGSNTIHLLVGEVDGGAVLPVTGEKVSARLGAGVEKTGRIAEERLSLAGGCHRPLRLDLCAERRFRAGDPCHERGARRGEWPGANGEGAGAYGSEDAPDLGREEAALGFQGAVSAVGTSLEGPVLVVDLGGGSAQLIVGEASSGPLMQVSLPLGSNRTTERFVGNDPAKKKELRALDEHVKEMVPGWSLSQRVSVVAVGGSARAILKITRDSLRWSGCGSLPSRYARFPRRCSRAARAHSRAGAGDAGGDHHARRDTGALR